MTRLTLAVMLASTLGLAALSACDDPPPAPAVDPSPAVPPAPEPASYSVHEWGFIAHHYADTADGVRALTGPPPRSAMQAVQDMLNRPGSLGHGAFGEARGGKPILYVHLGEGTTEATFQASLVLRGGGRFVEHLPPGDLQGTTLRWDVRARRGSCSAAARYPSAGSAGCEGIEDGYCEAAELARYETEDSSCLTVGGADWNHLFYRGDIAGPLPIQVSREGEGFAVRNAGGSPLPGKLMRIRRNLDTSLTRLQVFDAPAQGETLPLPNGTETGSVAGRQAIEDELAALGMTQEETDAFMNAWSVELFGAPSLLGHVDPTDAPGGPPCELLPKADALVYFLPAEALNAMVALEFTPAPTDVRRALLVRIDLEPSSDSPSGL